jgi:DNA recombination protein RmuC
MDILPFILTIVALVAGLALGWFFGGRGAAALAAEKVEIADRLAVTSEQRNAALRDLAVEKDRAEQATGLRDRLDAVQGERENALRELASLQSETRARTEAFEAQIRALGEAKEQLSAQFSEIGGKLLENAKKSFLETADRSFAQANLRGSEQIKTLLQPVETTLKRYEEGLQRVEKERVGSYNELREAVRQVHVGQGQVRDETAKLINALRAAPKTRGRWGEQQFKNLIETAGLSAFVDFREEVSVEVEGGALRPDFIIRLPGDQQLVVDVKCSLEAYLNAVDQPEQAVRERYLADHARAVRTHADALGRKAYWEQFEKAPDFVIMYVPGDNFVTAALEADMDLWERAARNRVIICGPATFLPLARTLAGHWRQARMQDEAKQIGALGKELYERLAVASGHLRKVGSGLNSAVSNYNNFVNSFESRVLVTGRKLRDLNIETGAREIEAADAVEALAREPQGEAQMVLPDTAEAAE